MKKLLILKTGNTLKEISLTYGDFENWIIDASGFPANQFFLFTPYLSEPFPDPRDFAGIIITGSHAMITEPERWTVETATWLRMLIETDIPIFGICYGHQLIAYAMGGTVGYHPKGMEIGAVEIETSPLTDHDPLFHNLPKRFMAYTSHEQSVLSLPEGAEVLAFNLFEPYHALKIRNNCWGVQFHPEFTPAIMKSYILAQQDTLREKGIDPIKISESISPSPLGRSLIQRFCKIALTGR